VALNRAEARGKRPTRPSGAVKLEASPGVMRVIQALYKGSFVKDE
jgi:hypothetical protein